MEVIIATQFPTTKDTYADPAATDVLGTAAAGRGLAGEITDLNDAVKAIETKVGVDNSAVTTTHDYKLSGVTGSDKAVSKTGTETLTNKTLTAPIVSTISNTGTITLPTSTDTLVGRATTDTLTNKTLTSPTINTPTFSAGAVATAAIAANAVSQVGYSTTFTDPISTSATYTSISMSFSFTPTGGTVIAVFYIAARFATATANLFAQMRLKRGATVLKTGTIWGGTALANVREGQVLVFSETPAAATYTYDIEISNANGAGTINVEDAYLLLVELKK